MNLDSKEAYEKFIDYTFMQVTDNSRAGKLEEDLTNKFSLFVNIYPCNLENSTNMVINYKKYVNNPNHTSKENQQSNKYSEKYSDGKLLFIKKDYTNLKWYSCGNIGYIPQTVPTKSKKKVEIIKWK